MSGKPFVFVIDAQQRPLMPCTGKRARLLLTRRRARVHRMQPFTIQLFDRTQDDCVLQDMIVKIDPGSKTTGLCVARLDADQGVHVIRLIELTHRGQRIKLNLMKRAMLRRNRRQRKTRYRQARFLNRTRPKGWLPPSLRHRVDTTLSWVRRLSHWCPVTELAVERVKFDMQKMRNHEIAGVQYQQGTLFGYEVREYLLEKWQRKCAYCGTDQVTRFEIDHFMPRSRGGSDAVSNLVLSCRPCNQAKGVQSAAIFLVNDPVRLAHIQRQLKTPMHDAAAVNATRNALFTALLHTDLPVTTGTGGQTKHNRVRLRIPKTHALDAACVGEIPAVYDWQRKHLSIKCTGRGSYARTATDKYGFPRQYSARSKYAFGFQTGDLVRVNKLTWPIPKIGRLTVRQNGGFIFDDGERAHFASWRQCIRFQRADGYNYVTFRPACI